MNDITKKPLDYQGKIFPVTAEEYENYMTHNIIPKSILDFHNKAQQETQKPSLITQASPDISDILTQRGNRYGSFDGHAAITQGIKDVYILAPKWNLLEDDMKEALDMVAHKIGRILNGDPNYLDSWDDIQGYTKLVSDRLRKTGQGY